MRRIGLKTSATKRTWNPKMGGQQPLHPCYSPNSIWPLRGASSVCGGNYSHFTDEETWVQKGCQAHTGEPARGQPPAAAFLCSLSDCLEVPGPQVSNAVAQRWLLCLLGPRACERRGGRPAWVGFRQHPKTPGRGVAGSSHCPQGSREGCWSGPEPVGGARGCSGQHGPSCHR